MTRDHGEGEGDGYKYHGADTSTPPSIVEKNKRKLRGAFADRANLAFAFIHDMGAWI